MNAFEQILRSTCNVQETLDLARAFVASNGEREGLWACMRLLDTLSGRSGGHLAAYLDGCHFMISGAPLAELIEYSRSDDLAARSMIEVFRTEAFEFLGK